MPIILLGVVFGLMLTFSPGSVAMVFVFSITAVLVYQCSDTSYKKFLLILFVVGITSRVFLLFLIHTTLAALGKFHFPEYGYITSLFGDSGYYTLRSWWLSQFIQDIELPKKIIESTFIQYGSSYFLYVLALFHSLFGFSPISSTLINCYLGTLTALLVFFTAKLIFNTSVAKISSTLVMFFPSLFVWSLTNLKDSSLIFIIVLTLFCFIKFYLTHKKLYLVPFLISLALLPGFRLGFFPTMLTIILLTTFIIWKKATFKKMILILILCLLVLTNFGSVKHYLDKTIVYIAKYHKGVITTGGYVYRLLDSKFYIGKNVEGVTYTNFFKMVPKGIIHFCLEPFPWHIESLSMLLAFPQMIFWYLMIFLSLIGVLMALRYQPRISTVLIIYLIISTLVLSVSGGNIGTDFRHRDILTPIIFIFGSAGLLKIIGKMHLKQESDRPSE
jgi:hypothetical protein